MGSVEVVELTNDDPRFYHWIGPFLGSREVHRELGGPVYDDPGKRWWVARKRDVVVGFCALTVDGGTARLGSAYVVPEERNDGVYSALFVARLDAALALAVPLRAVVRPDAKKLFAKNGFTATRETANYIYFARESSVPKKRGKR